MDSVFDPLVEKKRCIPATGPFADNVMGITNNKSGFAMLAGEGQKQKPKGKGSSRGNQDRGKSPRLGASLDSIYD